MTTTTAVQSPWAIVDQIIRQEIPDAVPGCDRLRDIPKIVDGKSAWKAAFMMAYVLSLIETRTICEQRLRKAGLISVLSVQVIEVMS